MTEYLMFRKQQKKVIIIFFFFWWERWDLSFFVVLFAGNLSGSDYVIREIWRDMLKEENTFYSVKNLKIKMTI